MARPNYGPQAKKRAKRLLEALLAYANNELENCDHQKIQVNWQTEKQLVVRTKVRFLEELTVKDPYDGKLNNEQIKEALKRLEDFLEILEDNRTQTQGKEDWHFTLRLWGKDTAKNLSQFDREWENKRPEKSKSYGAEPEVVLTDINGRPLLVAKLELPKGQVPLNSGFYIERSPIEKRCYEEILQPGALIRIKAPRLMGKTSLMARILYKAREHGYQTVPLSFQLADRAVFTNLDTFLRWFCESIGRRLHQLNQLDDYWTTYGSKDKTTAYFEECLLEEITSPLVVSLDGVDRLFPYRDIADDFFSLLRAWYEYAKYGDSSSELWKKLRVVLVHCKEVYIPLDINQSPFNVGLSVELQEFSLQQVQDLVGRHSGLNWTNAQTDKLMDMVGGHPYLVRLALYHIQHQDITLEQLLQTAFTEAGIYSDHLRRHLRYLKQHPDLAAAFSHVVTTPAPVELDSESAFKLHSMGLVVHRHENKVAPRCNLYRQYFHHHLGQC